MTRRRDLVAMDVWVDREDRRALFKLATERWVTPADLMREAVRAYLADSGAQLPGDDSLRRDAETLEFHGED